MAAKPSQTYSRSSKAEIQPQNRQTNTSVRLNNSLKPPKRGRITGNSTYRSK